MAGREMELLVKLGAKLEQSYPAAVRKALAEASKLQAEISKKTSIKGNAEKFEQMSQQARGMSEAFNVAKAKAAGLGAELDNQQNLVAKYKAQIDLAKTALSGMSRSANNPAYQAAKANIAQLTAAMVKARSDMKATRLQYQAAENNVKTLGDAYTSHTAKLKKLEMELEQAGFSTKNFANSFSMLENSMAGAEANYKRYHKLTELDAARQQNQEQKKLANKNLAEKQQNLYNAYGNFANAQDMAQTIVSPFIEATREAMKFESAMADVKKVVDFDTPQQFEKMNDDILKLSQTLPMIPEDIAAIAAAGGQSGIARKDLMSFAESAAKMGIAFDITADQAGDMMAKWRTAFKMNQEQVVALADKVNLLGNTTAAAAPLISDVLTRIGPLGEVGGFASGEIAAMGASMVSAGVQSDVAATGIKNMMLAMTAGTSATKTQDAAFARLGIDAVDLAKRMQTDASGAVIDLMKRLQGLEKYEQSAVLANIFGKESIGPITTLLNNLPALEDNLRKVGDASQYTGSMEAEYAARSATTENKLQLLQNTIGVLSKKIGGAFLPIISQAADFVAQYSDSITAWIEENKEAIKWIGLIAAAVAGAIVAVSAFALAFAGFQFITAQLAAMKTAFTGLNIMVKMTTLAMAGISIPAILGIIAVIAVLALLAAKWEYVKETAEIVWNHIAGTVSAQIERIKAAFGGAINKITEVWNSVTGQSASSAEFLMGIINNVGFAIGAVFDIVAGIVGTAISVILNQIVSLAQIIGGVVNIIAGILTGDWDRAWKGAGQAVDGFLGGTVGAIKTFAGGISDMFDTLMGKADEVENKAKAAQNSLAGSQMSGADAMRGLREAGTNPQALADAQQMASATAEASTNAQNYAANMQQAGAGAQQASGYAAELQKVMQQIPNAAEGAFAGMGDKAGMAAQAINTNMQQVPTGVQQTCAQLPPIAQTNTDGMVTEFSKLTEKCQPGGEAFIQAANTWGQQAYENIAKWADQMAQVVVDKLTQAWAQISAQFSAGLNVNVTTSAPNVAHNAEGGIYNKGAFLTTFAEDGPEAAIPLDGSKRAISLWSRAGEILGLLPKNHMDLKETVASTRVNLPPVVNTIADVAIPAMEAQPLPPIMNMVEALPPEVNTIADVAIPAMEAQLLPPIMNMVEALPPDIGSIADVAAPPTEAQLAMAPVAMEPAGGGGGDMSIEINMPAITINGNADAQTVDSMASLMEKLKADLIREMRRQFPSMMESNRHQERRLSYAT